MSVKVDYQNKIDTKSINPINKNDSIDVFYLTGAGYVNYPFRGISRDSALGWDEPVWGAELTRSATNFVMTNILDVDYGLVARLEVSYKYMNVQDYIVLCKIAKERVCTATYFNYEKGVWVKNQEFAFTKQEKSKLYAFGADYIGLLDVSVKLVATNRDRVDEISATHTITYYANGATGTAPTTQSATWGDNITIAEPTSLSYNGKEFKEWNTMPDGTGGKYLPNQSKTMWEDMGLYAIWERSI